MDRVLQLSDGPEEVHPVLGNLYRNALWAWMDQDTQLCQTAAVVSLLPNSYLFPKLSEVEA